MSNNGSMRNDTNKLMNLLTQAKSEGIISSQEMEKMAGWVLEDFIASVLNRKMSLKLEAFTDKVDRKLAQLM